MTEKELKMFIKANVLDCLLNDEWAWEEAPELLRAISNTLDKVYNDYKYLVNDVSYIFN